MPPSGREGIGNGRGRESLFRTGPVKLLSCSNYVDINAIVQRPVPDRRSGTCCGAASPWREEKMASRVLLLLGTRKGAFIVEGDAGRRSWTLRGPFCETWPMNHVVGDPASGTIYGAGGDAWFGPAVWKSTDFGESWTHSSAGLAYDAGEEPISRPGAWLRPTVPFMPASSRRACSAAAIAARAGFMYRACATIRRGRNGRRAGAA